MGRQELALGVWGCEFFAGLVGQGRSGRSLRRALDGAESVKGHQKTTHIRECSTSSFGSTREP